MVATNGHAVPHGALGSMQCMAAGLLKLCKGRILGSCGRRVFNQSYQA